MTMGTKKEILDRYFEEYKSPKTSKSRRTAILNTICEVTGLHRKSVIRKFRQLQFDKGPPPKRKGRPKKYTPDVISALRTVWECSSQLCGELVHSCINDYVDVLKKNKRWKHRKITTEKLLLMSEATVKREVSKFIKARFGRKGMSCTRPSHIKTIIPIFTGPWGEKPCGYGQIDTVVHCGSTLSGDMAYSVNYTDVKTSWIVLSVQWNKGQENTCKSLKRIKNKTPFPILGLHPDNGSEFVNYHLKGWCDKQGIEMTRSRPNHKNDNAYVEQKNGHVIRRFLGYQRFDYQPVIEEINTLYDVLDDYINHFLPTRKCIQKIRIGSKYKRKYDKGRAPYQRVLECDNVPPEVKQKLKDKHDNLNPLELLSKINKLLENIRRIQDHGNKITTSKIT